MYNRSPVPHPQYYNDLYSSGGSSGTYANPNNYNYPAATSSASNVTVTNAQSGQGRRRPRSDHSNVESYSQQDLNERDEEYKYVVAASG